MKLSRSFKARLHVMMDDAQALIDEYNYRGYNQDRLRYSLEELLRFGEEVLEEENRGSENIRKAD